MDQENSSSGPQRRRKVIRSVPAATTSSRGRQAIIEAQQEELSSFVSNAIEAKRTQDTERVIALREGTREHTGEDPFPRASQDPLIKDILEGATKIDAQIDEDLFVAFQATLDAVANGDRDRARMVSLVKSLTQAEAKFLLSVMNQIYGRQYIQYSSVIYRVMVLLVLPKLRRRMVVADESVTSEILEKLKARNIILSFSTMAFELTKIKPIIRILLIVTACIICMSAFYYQVNFPDSGIFSKYFVPSAMRVMFAMMPLITGIIPVAVILFLLLSLINIVCLSDDGLYLVQKFSDYSKKGKPRT